MLSGLLEGGLGVGSPAACQLGVRAIREPELANENLGVFMSQLRALRF